MTQQAPPPAGMPAPDQGPGTFTGPGAYPGGYPGSGPAGYGPPTPPQGHQGPQGPRSPQGAPAPGSAPAAARTNTVAVVALVLAFVAPILGIVFGVVGRRQIARTGEGGKGLATAGIVLGSIFTAIGAATLAVVFVVAASITPSVPSSSVEAQIVEQVGLSPGEVSCPGDLPAQVGASMVCTATVDGAPLPLRTTVTSVVGDQANFDIVSE